MVTFTGASSGIGATACEHFARLGASLVLVARTVSGLETTKQNCIKAGASADTVNLIPNHLLEEVGWVIMVHVCLRTDTTIL